MSSLRICIATKILAASSFLLLAGCTSTAPIEDRPPDMQEVGKVLNCPIDRLPTCARRTSRRYDCYCSDKDLMREILDPEIQ